jgi:hypothetical protein
MGEKTRKNMAARLASLMRTSGSDTLEKVAKQSGTSYGTVRRVRLAMPTDVGIDNVEAIAESFGLSLVEFVSEFDTGSKVIEVSGNEAMFIEAFRNLPDIDQQRILYTTMSDAAFFKAKSKLELGEQEG